MAHVATILIADGNAESAANKAKFLSDKGYRTETVCASTQVVARAALHQPDIVLLGTFEDTPDQLALAKSLRGNPATHLTPIALTEAHPDTIDADTALELGVDDLFTIASDQREILARLPRLARFSVLVSELERRIETAQDFGLDVDPMSFHRDYAATPNVMAVAQNPERLSALGDALTGLGLECTLESDAFKAADQLDDRRYDAVLISLSTGDDLARAQYLFGHIRNNPRLFNLPTLVVAEQAESARDMALYRSGAAFVLSGPVPHEEMVLYLKMLVARQRVRWTLRDPYKATLAGPTQDSCQTAYSDAFWTGHLKTTLANAAARESNLSVGLFAVPTLPRIREEFGDENAEILAHQLADWITGMTRIEDTVARIGPDTFAAMFPDTPEAEANRVVQRIVGILHNSEFHLGEEVMQVIHAVVEGGTAGLETGDQSADLMARAKYNLL